MAQESSSTKKTRTTKSDLLQKDFDELQARFNKLEELFVKVTTMSGWGNELVKAGYSPWVPPKKQ